MHGHDSDAYFAAYISARERHLSNLLARINVAGLTSLASDLRHGVPCKIPALAADIEQAARAAAVARQMGGQNCHVDVEFEDGVVWIARIRLDDPSLPPLPVQNYIFLSEVFTLKFLEQTAVPSPKVFHYALESPDIPVGVSFMLMEKMSGIALDWNDATENQRTKVMEQLVTIFLELEKHPFKMTGSIVPAGSVSTIGGFAQPPLFESPEERLGPFAVLESALSAIMQHQMATISNREVTSLPVDNYLTYRWRLDAISSIVSSTNNGGPFYLKHFDDKGDHILVDDDYNITGIIDWEFASAEARELAFSSPCMMWPVGDFYDGKNSLSKEELEFAKMFERRDRKDLSRIIKSGRQFQRFLFFIGGGTSEDQAEFEALFQGLRSSFISEGGQALQSYDDWKQSAIEKYSKDDTNLQRLLREERATAQNAEAAPV